MARISGPAVWLIGTRRRVDADDVAALLTTVVVAMLVEVGMRALRLPRLAQLAHVPMGVPAEDAIGDAAEPALSGADRRHLRVAIRVMRHWPFDEKCLRMALVCGWWVRARHPRLVIGVALVEGDVNAHAWLDVGGASLDPSGTTEFLRLLPVSSQ